MNGIPDLVQPVEGWRVWKIVMEPSPREGVPVLRSVIMDTRWTPRKKVWAEHSSDLEARCQGLLRSSCSCGMYAFKNPADASAYLRGVRDRVLGMDVDTAIGTVSLWGKVVECERGYRAQYACPRHLYLPARACQRAQEVADAFGVPVGVYACAAKEAGGSEESFKYVDACCKSLVLKKSRVPEGGNAPLRVEFYDHPAISQCPSSG